MISTTNTEQQGIQIENHTKAKLLNERVSIKNRRRCVVCSKLGKMSDVKNDEAFVQLLFILDLGNVTIVRIKKK